MFRHCLALGSVYHHLPDLLELPVVELDCRAHVKHPVLGIHLLKPQVAIEGVALTHEEAAEEGNYCCHLFL